MNTNSLLPIKLAAYLPAACLLCKAPVRGMPLCEGCRLDLPWNKVACPNCALPLTGHQDARSTHHQCPPELGILTRTFSAFIYEPPCSTLLKTFKHRERLAQGHLLGKLMADYLVRQPSLQDPDTHPEVLLPIPLHWQRLQYRGFNQSHLIARIIGLELGIPVLDYAIRNRQTGSQQQLNLTSRRDNLIAAFRLRRPLPARHIAIIDDVMTTGTTVTTLAKVLLDAGAKSVEAWTLARTPLRTTGVPAASPLL